MQTFAILTDSSADLNISMVQQADVTVVPLSVHLDGKTYLDWPDQRELPLDEFYSALRAGKHATTNAVNVDDFTRALDPLLAGGQDVLMLAFSSGLSSTYQSAELAAKEMAEKYPQRKIYVVDTLCGSMGQGLLVWYCAQQRREGKTLEQVRDWAEENKLSICHHLTVNDLHHLKRGGRISATTAIMGTMLSIKPMIHVDNDGRLVTEAKARGRAVALKMLVDQMEKTAFDPGDQTVFISHSDCLADAESVADMIRTRFGTKDIQIGFIGPVVGAHTGPGTVVLFYRGSPR